MFTDEQIEELIDLIIELDSDKTKIYIGTDSVRFKKSGQWYAKYATVCVVHKRGKNGCKIFQHHTVELDHDMKKNRPALRLMNEVYKSCALYLQLAPFIKDLECELHMDINPDIKHGSSCVSLQAAGYALGVTGLTENNIKQKPAAWAASFSADHYANRAAS